MDVDRLDNVHVEAVSVDLVCDLLDLVDLPDLAGHLVVQRPDDAGHARDLLDVAEGDGIVALTIPAPTHFHRHSGILLVWLCGVALLSHTLGGTPWCILIHILIYQLRLDN